jgi:polyhydroxyalkanoate synthesis regulator phasin
MECQRTAGEVELVDASLAVPLAWRKLRGSAAGGEAMLRDNPVVKKMIETGEQRVGQLATRLLSNETLMGALQKTVSAAMEAKGLVERNVQNVLSTMHIPTAGDVQRLQGKIEELERVFDGLSAKIAELQKTETPPASAQPPPN